MTGHFMAEVTGVFNGTCWMMSQAMFFIPATQSNRVTPVFALIPLLLIAAPLVLMRTKPAGKAAVYARYAMAAPPLVWLIPTAIDAANWYQDGLGHPTLPDTVTTAMFWSEVGLWVAIVPAALIFGKGRRIVTVPLALINLWFLVLCGFIGFMAVTGDWI